ncbi:phage protein NinX family protein [Pantoea dispersa]|uniref:phage protein NinX family protein n=1 Tax=Pantoea dispersa TaxID=59814 RepID=UPI0028DF874D|nr:phage protein NinX family protein [Pantoea dispersa]MDT8853006.1 phage protein NinX family protein [Pantoea dispersa]
MEQMMNHTKMSDFEINKAVGEIILEGKWACKPGCAGNQSDSWHYGSVDTFVTPYPALPDYCNSWADAGPIIEQKKISLEFVGMWRASTYEGIEREANENPLRAAMIVLLMMQEKPDAA